MPPRPDGAREMPTAGPRGPLLAAEHEAGRRLGLARAEAAGLLDAARASAQEHLEGTAGRLAAATAQVDAAIADRRATAVDSAAARRRATVALVAHWDDARCEALAGEVIAALLAEAAP